MLKSMSAGAGVYCVQQRRRRVWSRVLRTSRREPSSSSSSSSTGEQSHKHTHTHRRSRYTSDCVRVCVCVCVLAVAIKTRPAESAAAARDSVGLRSSSWVCCDVRVRVRECVYVCVRARVCVRGRPRGEWRAARDAKTLPYRVWVFSLLLLFRSLWTRRARR